MLYTVAPVVITVAGSLEDIEEADDVAVDIALGRIDAVSYPGLGGKIDDDVGRTAVKDAVYGVTVGNVGMDKGETTMGKQRLEALGDDSVHLAGIIIVVHIVDAYDAQP